MHVLLDVHAANNYQQSAVARSIASSHEDLHEVTSISSCADPNSQSAFPSTLTQREWISAWNSDQQPRFILFNKLFQQFLIDGLQTVPSTNFLIWRSISQPSDLFWHASRSSSRIVHSLRRSEPILHSPRCSGYFSKFSNFSHPSRTSDYFSKFSPQKR